MSIHTLGDIDYFLNVQCKYSDCAYDPINKKIIVVYQHAWPTEGIPNRAYYVVGSVDGSIDNMSITWETPVLYLNDYYSSYVGIVYEAVSDKFVLTGRHYGAAVGTLTGTTLVLETPVLFDSIDLYNDNIQCQAENGKVVITYIGENSGEKGRIVIGTITGSTITFGPPVDWSTSEPFSSYGMAVTSDGGKVAIFFRLDSAPRTVYAVGCTISGTLVVVGTAVTLGLGDPDQYNSLAVGYAKDNESFLFVCSSTLGNGIYAVSGHISGTTIVFGDLVNVTSINSGSGIARIVYNPIDKGLYYVYSDFENRSYPSIIGFYLAGTSFSYTTSLILAEEETYYPSIVYDSYADRMILTATGAKGFSVVIKTDPIPFWTNNKSQTEILL